MVTRNDLVKPVYRCRQVQIDSGLAKIDSTALTFVKGLFEPAHGILAS